MIPSKRPNLIVLNLGIGKVLDHNGPGALPETNERKTVSSASSHSYPRRLYRQVPSASLQRPNEENHRCLDGPCKIKLFLIWRRLIQPGERSLPITKITALSGLNHSIWQLDGYIYLLGVFPRCKLDEGQSNSRCEAIPATQSWIKATCGGYLGKQCWSGQAHFYWFISQVD